MTTDAYPNKVSDDSDSYMEEDYERLDRAFSALSDAQREIIVLSRYQGFKYEEISAIINSMKAVTSRSRSTLKPAKDAWMN